MQNQLMPGLYFEDLKNQVVQIVTTTSDIDYIILCDGSPSRKDELKPIRITKEGLRYLGAYITNEKVQRVVWKEMEFLWHNEKQMIKVSGQYIKYIHQFQMICAALSGMMPEKVNISTP